MSKRDLTDHSEKANSRDKSRDKWGLKAIRQKQRRNKHKRQNLETGKHWK